MSETVEALRETIHASCVLLAGGAVLLGGRSGSGKSDLALRLVDRGAKLVSDDYTEVTQENGSPVARAPRSISGQIEVRGIGIVEMHAAPYGEVRLLVLLDKEVPRMPDILAERVIAGLAVPTVALAGLEPSAPLKVALALERFGHRPR